MAEPHRLENDGQGAAAAASDPGSEVSPVNVMIVGVGGQGVILVSKVLALLAQQRGLEVKQSEVHGMAKRGGTVFSHVRYGPKVWSPTIARGEADILVALEWAEALRWLPWLKPGGTLVCDTKRIVPPFACLNRRPGAPLRYPAHTPEQLRQHMAQACAIDATTTAVELGNERVANVVLLGAMAEAMDFTEAEWDAALVSFVPPKTVEVNRQAFQAGRQWARRARAAGDAASQPEDGLPSNGVAPDGAAPGREGLAAGLSQGPATAVTGGACEALPSAIHLEITRAWCKSCDICVKLCPERCLQLDGERIAVLIDPARCTGCRLCEWLCPDFAIRVQLDTCSEQVP